MKKFVNVKHATAWRKRPNMRQSRVKKLTVSDAKHGKPLITENPEQEIYAYRGISSFR
jgi:hypothetical protein